MAIQARLEEQLNQIEETLQATSNWVKHLTTENLDVSNSLLVQYMTMNHLKSTLLYIKGDVDNINEQIDLNLKDAMAVFGIGL